MSEESLDKKFEELSKKLTSITLIQQKEALDIEDAALLTGLSKAYLYKLCQSNSIPHYKSKGGKKIYFKKSELNEWMLGIKVKTKAELEQEARVAVLLN